MNNLIQKLLVVFVAAFVIVQYTITQILDTAPNWLLILRIVLLIVVIITSFAFTISYDKQSKGSKEKDAPKSLTKNLFILYLVLAMFYGVFKLRGVI